MTIAEAIQQLTKGFIKVMGRKPEALEKIKIKQEAGQKLRDLNKVVDMEGEVIDTSKGIMGGKEIKAMGGRAGFKDGPDQPGRRKFMKIMGGLAAIPIIGKYFRGAEKAAPIAEKAVEVAGQAPSYFFDLVTKIKLLGEPRRTPTYKERVNEYQYTGKDGIEYELTEDLDTGEIMIQKDKIGVGGSGDESFDVITDRTELRYKKPKPDEVDPNPAEEYEEFKVEFDSDGTAADATEIDDLSRKEIIEEVSAGGGNVPESFYEGPNAISRITKKASGGIARMLGE